MAIALCALAASSPAWAGIAGSVVPSYPTPVKVGDIKTATITITNRATSPNATELVNVTEIFLTPACAASDGFTCTSPDPGVFQFASALGKGGSSCAGVSFTPTTPDPYSGAFQLLPPSNNPVVLGPADRSGTLPPACVIAINFKVLQAPKDSTPGDPTRTTDSLAHATMKGATSGNTGMGAGGSTTIIGGGPDNVAPAIAINAPTSAATWKATASPLAMGGTASDDVGVTTVAWTNAATGGKGTASGTTAWNASVPLAVGNNVITMTASDAAGNAATATLTVAYGNQAPVANAGPDQTALVGTAVTLNASASYDPDGTVVGYAWNFGDGQSVNAGGAASVTHAYAAAGVYNAVLTVTDNTGAQATDTATVTVVSSTGAVRWAKRLGGASSTAASYSTAVDASGNVIVAGAFWGTVDFGGGPLTSAGSSDVFVAKYSPSGAFIWARRFGAEADDVAYAVAVDGSGNVIVAGGFKGTVDFGTGRRTAYNDGSGTATHDAFIAKYSPSGVALWSTSFGSYGEDYTYGVAVDGSGNMVVTGTFFGPVDFGGTMLWSTSSSADIFVAKYSPAGALLWAERFGERGADVGYGVAVDAAGNIYATGAFVGTVDFGTGPLTSNGNAEDIYVAKLSPAGQGLWARSFGDTGQDIGHAVAADPAGNVVVTGYFGGTVDFGGGPVQSHGLLDTFVAKYSPTGQYLWSWAFGGTNADEGFGVATDKSGNVFIAGSFQDKADFGKGALTSAGSWDIVAAKYASDGTPLWTRQFGGAGDDLGYAVATDANGNAFFTGVFQGTVSFGATPLTSAGWTDSFIVNMAP